jgi:hypothetical protein
MKTNTNRKTNVSDMDIENILNSTEEIKAHAFALITAIEFDLYNDPNDETLPLTGGGHFYVDKKVLLETFGETLNSKINVVKDLVKRLKNEDEE